MPQLTRGRSVNDFGESIDRENPDAQDTGALGIDERGQLYWSGEPVITEHRVSLPWWIDLSLVIGSLSLLVIAAAVTWSYLKPLLIEFA